MKVNKRFKRFSITWYAQNVSLLLLFSSVLGGMGHTTRAAVMAHHTHQSSDRGTPHTSLLILAHHTPVFLSWHTTHVFLSWHTTHQSSDLDTPHTFSYLGTSHTSLLILAHHTPVFLSWHTTHQFSYLGTSHTSLMILAHHTPFFLSWHITHQTSDLGTSHTSLLIVKGNWEVSGNNTATVPVVVSTDIPVQMEPSSPVGNVSSGPRTPPCAARKNELQKFVLLS
jgi:hypothetical protein